MTNNEQRDGMAGDSQLGDRCMICEKAEREGIAEVSPAERKHAVEHTVARLEAKGAIRRSGIWRPSRNGEMQPVFQVVPKILEG